MSFPVPASLTLRVVAEILAKEVKRPVNPSVAEELDKIIKRHEAQEPRHKKVDDCRRIERQRTLFTMLPSSTATDKMKAAMLDRAWSLLDAGECERCDELLEWLPSTDAQKLLDEYFPEDAA